MPILGIHHYPGTALTIYPLGSVAAVFYCLMVGYSVFHHQLLDVHFALGRMAAHLIRFIFLFVVTLTLMLLLGEFYPGEFTFVSFVGPIGVLLLGTLISTLLFPRIFGSGSEDLERRLLGDRFEYHDRVNDFIETIQRQANLASLLDSLHELLLEVIHNYQIVLLHETAHYLKVLKSHPAPPVESVSEFNTASHIYHYFRKSKATSLSLRPFSVDPEECPESAKARQQMRKLGAEYCFAFNFRETCFGFMLVGAKQNGEPYTVTDTRLLGKLASHLSTALNQFRLMNQLLAVKEEELLGRMTRGMAHDLNNLLTPISVQLQLAAEKTLVQAPKNELLSMAMENLHAIQSYIRESLFFSQNLGPDFQKCQMDALVSNTVGQLRSKLDARKIQLCVNIPAGLETEVNEVLIQRLISNLLSNAIDASPEGAPVLITAHSLVVSEFDWLRIQIVDHGAGINDSDRDLVAMPYFTTKKTGDAQRGFGLGLAICRRIARFHGGTVTLLNSMQSGTIVNLDIPRAQANERLLCP